MATETISNLSKVWNLLGPFNMVSFNDRILLQKKIFLLQETGFDLGYNFSLYIRGPYSSALADDGYKVNSVSDSSEKLNYMEAVNKINMLEKNHYRDSSWFELLATIVYYSKKCGKTKTETKKLIFETKTHLANSDLFEEAYSALIRNGFLIV